MSEKKVHCSQVSNESFYQSDIERLLHLDPEDCTNELKILKINTNENRNMVNFQLFPDSAHQAQVEHHQGHVQLDNKIPYHGANRHLTYDLNDNNWIPQIGINNPSNCKADKKIQATKK